MNTRIKMQKSPAQERRSRDPFLDRRSGEDRREVYSIAYFSNEGRERRLEGRRAPGERRNECVRISEWSSVCVEDSATPKAEDRSVSELQASLQDMNTLS